MTKTTEITVAQADARGVADEASETGVPVTVMKNDAPMAEISPDPRNAVDVAVAFMDEYASVFEGLAT